MCNEQKGKPNAFVREVRTAPELSVVLTTDRQLTDIERFIAKSNSSVLGVDPTFNICPHNVTITTYRHPLVVVKNSNVHPVLLGPTLIHASKTFESYYTLPSTMVKLKKELAKIRSFGSDGEVNVADAMQTCFPCSKQLLCWIHSRDNVEVKLKNLGVKDKQQYMEEIYGKRCGNLKIKGLLDVVDDREFEEKWKTLEEKWKQRGNSGIAFLKYMQVYKKEKMRNCMIAGVRSKCGLGTPPEEYTQNANESINSVVKRAKGFGEISVKATIQIIQNEVSSQEEKLRQSLIGKGEWRIDEKFREKFEITEEKFYKMTNAQRQRYF